MGGASSTSNGINGRIRSWLTEGEWLVTTTMAAAAEAEKMSGKAETEAPEPGKHSLNRAGEKTLYRDKERDEKRGAYPYLPMILLMTVTVGQRLT